MKTGILKKIARSITGVGLHEKSSGQLLRCPACKKKRLQLSDAGLKCSCFFELPRIVCGKELTDEQLITLAVKRKTLLIAGFLSPTGEAFSVKLKLYVQVCRVNDVKSCGVWGIDKVKSNP
jgi:primosomal replication protein N